jgi:diguanylate cyclase (GGDEF)-like protein
VIKQAISGRRRLNAGRAFGLLAAAFVIVFGLVVTLLAIDQSHVIENTHRLQEQTVPEILRFQRLARNLEQLRQEGERVFSVATPEARQQAAFIVTLVASHPSVLEHKEAAALAAETERFISEVTSQGNRDAGIFRNRYGEWQRLSSRLSILVDDVSIQGVNRASADLGEVSASMGQARQKLLALLALAGIFLLSFLFLLRRHLIAPLQRIDRALSRLDVNEPSPHFPPSAMTEILAVEDAIGELHDLLTSNEAARRELEALANRDGLTGLINRRYFLHCAEAELLRASRYRRPISIGMADLDFFKRLNDTYGHPAGDAVLRAFAKLFQESLRSSDLICRYGGEEFAFLFPESTLEEAQVLAERFRQRCAENEIELPDGRYVSITLSIGLADAANTPIDVSLRKADDALYEAKRRGRNQVVVADSPEGLTPPAAES